LNQLVHKLKYDEKCQIEIRFLDLKYDLVWKLQADDLIDRNLTPQTKASIRICSGHSCSTQDEHMKTKKSGIGEELKEKHKKRLARAQQELKEDEKRMRGQCNYISDLLLFGNGLTGSAKGGMDLIWGTFLPSGRRCWTNFYAGWKFNVQILKFTRLK